MKQNKKDFKEMLNASFASATPEMREDVRDAMIVTTPVATPERARRRTNYMRKYVPALVAACLCVVMLAGAVLGGVLLWNPAEPPATTDYSSLITVEINPAFSLTVDHDGNVECVTADNYDGEVVLEYLADKDVNLRLHYDGAISVLLSYAQLLGYFSTSDGIVIDIYNCTASKNTCDEMIAHISESISGVTEDNKTPTVTIGEMKREKLLAFAYEIQANISDAIEGSNLYELLKNKKSYSEKENGVGGNLSAEATDALYDLALLYYSVNTLNDLANVLDGIEDYRALFGIDAEALFERNDLYVRVAVEHANALLAWSGDTRRLTAETYESLRDYAVVDTAETDYASIETLLNTYRNGGTELEVLDGIRDRLLVDANLAACYEQMKEAHPANPAGNLLSGLMKLERTYREATPAIGSLGWLFGSSRK